MRRFLSALLVLSGLGVLPCSAAFGGDRFEDEGVILRLVAERPDETGRFRAALLVDLKPGWKTYWLDPGEAGIPPSLDFSRSNDAEGVRAHFPVPHRFDDGFASSIVYSEPFAVALEGRLDRADADLDLKLTLGLCQTICIPASAELLAKPGSAETDTGAVEAAFAALPRPSTGTQGIVAAALSADKTSLAVTVRPATASEQADLFVRGPKGWSFGPPASVERDARGATFNLPVTGRPRRNEATPTIDAVLAGPTGTWRADELAVKPAGS